MNSQKILLKGLTKEELKKYFTSIKYPQYRGEQIFNWMYNNLVTDFDEMKNLPLSLRNNLKENATLVTLNLTDSKISEVTNTKKLLFKTNSDNVIESVIIPERKRITLCVSTQVGCPLDCKFCATGIMGFKKNLSAGEIFDQYLLAQKNYENKITNIVFMGMGEPLLNYDETLRSLKIFSDELFTNVSLKKITISTAGIAPRITQLADCGLKIKLAFSLHSCFENIRSKIMPINKKYSLTENMEAIQYFYQRTKQRITFEYIMIKNINDREEDIKALIKLSKQIPSKINIIPFNSLRHMKPSGISAQIQPTEKNKIKIFAEELARNNVSVFIRSTQGDDISAGCGQLAINY